MPSTSVDQSQPRPPTRASNAATAARQQNREISSSGVNASGHSGRSHNKRPPSQQQKSGAGNNAVVGGDERNEKRARIGENQGQTTPRTPTKSAPPANSNSSSSSPSPSPSSPKREKRVVVVGFDNSEKNANRRSLGSCTDKVAEQRPYFGAWKTLDKEQQRDLVERLAPYKRRHPPDPQFDGWVNHFEYYCQIGANKRPGRQRPHDRSSFEDGAEENAGGGEENSPHRRAQNRSSAHNQQRQRLLGDRPRTTPGRMIHNDSNNNNSNNKSSKSAMESSNINGSDDKDPAPSSSRVADSRNRRSLEAMTRNYSGTRSERTVNSSRSLPVISGLDRRYMGLQSVDGQQMKEIVGRLSRMTSAYHAKFAPNPHVWIDNSPGAHMVVKRENTIA